MITGSENKQGFHVLPLRLFAGVMLLGFILTLSACGKKPSNVDPPPGTVRDESALVYPDPATDPKP